MFDFIKRHIGDTDEDGWCMDYEYFSFHPLNYGLGTLMRMGFRSSRKGWKILLHKFPPQEHEGFHDHPWGFRTIVIWGSYIDESLGPDGEVVRDVLRPGSTRVRPAHHAHRTIHKRTTWTIVLGRPKSRDWCKGDPKNWVCGGDVVDFDSVRGMIKVKS